MRVAIIGNSGSGKSTIARQMAVSRSIDVLDLDGVSWMPDQPMVRRPVESSIAEVRQFCSARDSWVVEGCYEVLIAATFEFRPELWFLDPGLEQCLSNCRSRPWEPGKFPSKKAQDENLPALVQWVRDYYTRTGEMSYRAHIDLYERYPGDKRWVRDVSTAAPG